MLYPMFLMVCLTFIVGLITVKVRFASIKSGDVRAKYYKLMSGQDVPDKVTQTTRHFNNQFELPVLFYVVCTLYLSFDLDSSIGLVCAWLFFVLRVIHSYIHLTYNHILHRMLSFWAGFICLMVLWVNLLVEKI